MKHFARNGTPLRTCGGPLVGGALSGALAAGALAAALAAAAPIPAFSGADADERTTGNGGERAKPAGGSILTPPAAELRELVGLLVDEDLEVRKAASDRLVAIGEPALPILEEEMRRRKLGAMGQVKITLLKLRSLREDRLWNEAIERLAAKPSETTLRVESAATSRKERGTGAAAGGSAPAPGEQAIAGVTTIKPGSKVRLSTAQGAGGAIALEVLFQPTEGPPRRVVATLARDRTLSPRSVEVRQGDRETTRFAIDGARMKGTAPSGDLDAPAPPPICLDWALPLVVAAMPRVAETELVLTLIQAESGAVVGLRTLHCLGEQPQGAGQAKAITAYELRGENVEPRRYEVDANGRIARAELGAGVTLSR